MQESLGARGSQGETGMSLAERENVVDDHVERQHLGGASVYESLGKRGSQKKTTEATQRV